MIVRNAVKSDIERLLPLCKEMYEESVYTYLPFEEDHVVRMITHYIEHPGAIALVAAIGFNVIGYFGGQISGYPFNSAKMASDMALFVTKEHRGSMAAVKLVRAWMVWAKRNKCVECRIGATALLDNSRTYRLYEALGYKLVGQIYARRF